MAVGASQDSTGTFKGAVYIVFLTTNAECKGVSKITVDNSDDEYLGTSVANLQDIDGDSVTDIAVGAPGADARFGAVYILFLKTDGTVKSSQVISQTSGGLQGPLPELAALGYSVAGAGDLDGDGTNDLVAGTPGFVLV